MLFVFIKKIDFESMPIAVANEIINISNVPVKLPEFLLSGEAYNLFEAEEDLFRNSYLRFFKAHNQKETDKIISSGTINYSQPNINYDAKTPPFSEKTLPNGGRLFKRIHGASASIAPNTIGYIDLVIPYPIAKFTGAEIFGTELGDSLDFFVLDTINNDYSGAPGSNYILNQFGFNVFMPKDRYVNSSDYDADIYQGMVIRCEYRNNGSATKTVYMNPFLHEVK